ncbi:cysteine desulfurase family protein [Texcoconibacillus texcoconensis]|uniref:Cysteine desulfurase n=1 Tax=Texcoconibacillus texcoconensis TaxID=1095777 RepID=A0A840QM68_9BACI|nr:aminotransferase class V-fold PLP-dependent enzyme [Texcoconibacillus texcoconensis]MBB5172441.1 cysteine desulfurase [Texcoconibacillus texcoconensis]
MLYLDNSATTKVAPEALDAMLPYLQEEYGNPASKYYTLAENSKNAVKQARNQVAAIVGCDPDEVIFTSGATESNNMVLKGIADYYENQNQTIITTKTEHPSIIDTCEYLESKGFHIIYLDVDKFGRVNPNKVKEAIENYHPLLVSIIWGNNELGSLNDIEKIAHYCAINNVFFHTDATQVIGKIHVDISEHPGIRFLSLSSHKIHGPKGIGACIIRKENETLQTKITPLIHGGGQEFEYRSGTLAVHNIVGFGKAAELAHLNLSTTKEHLEQLEKSLTDILINQFKDKISFNNDQQFKIPGLLSLQFKGVNNELLLKKLSNHMALSTGSACSSGKPSHVLSAAGFTQNEIQQTVRISMSKYINVDDLDFFKSLK